MPKVSVIILTKDRAALLKRALLSVEAQSLADREIIVIDDGSTDGTQDILAKLKYLNIRTFKHETSIGITQSRQEGLVAAAGDYVAFLDDDDEWVYPDKLKEQVEFLDANHDYVLVGGGIRIEAGSKKQEARRRPETDGRIRSTMLLRNNFFTSTVMFRREAALAAGGFLKDQYDLAEDYDLWLRMGKIGKMYNFHKVFTAYRTPGYNKDRLRQFFIKQLLLVNRSRDDYPHAVLAAMLLKFRILARI